MFKRKLEPDKYYCGFTEYRLRVNGFLNVENLQLNVKKKLLLLLLRLEYRPMVTTLQCPLHPDTSPTGTQQSSG